MKVRLFVFAAAIVGFVLAVPPHLSGVSAGSEHRSTSIKHVLLISVDGLHATDVAMWTADHPSSTLARLAGGGINYTQASTSRPSDSFPGMMALATGGSPQTTGVWYDVSYDHSLSPPGSSCKTTGTVVPYDESIDKDSTRLNAGGGIDPSLLPLNPRRGCTPEWPHQYLRVNTIFDVAHHFGMRTAWSDKHPSYEILNGPSGHGVDDLYNPEIAAIPVTVPATERYDALKVKAILNEIHGYDHTGTKKVGVPAMFGMNFQAVSVGQKDAPGGYLNQGRAFSPELTGAMWFVDRSIGRFVASLKSAGLLDSTLIIVTAKHGQAPTNRDLRKIISNDPIASEIDAVHHNLVAATTEDDIALVWLTDQAKTDAAVSKLWAWRNVNGLENILSGPSLSIRYDSPNADPRTPDIIGIPRLGVIYAGASATKIAEHGGFSDQDTNVPIILSNPSLRHRLVQTPVATTSVAPTILKVLGLKPRRLKAVRKEHTPLLPVR